MSKALFGVAQLKQNDKKYYFLHFSFFTNVYPFGISRNPSQFRSITPYLDFAKLNLTSNGSRSWFSYTVSHSPKLGENYRKSMPVQTALNFFWIVSVYTK